MRSQEISFGPVRSLRYAFGEGGGVGLGWWQSGSALDLDFANSLGYNSLNLATTTPDSILTYTSPSAKLVFGSDGVLGYAPHNLILHSSNMATTWTAANVTATADAITEEVTTGTHRVAQTPATMVGMPYTLSAELKPDGRDFAYLLFDEATDYFVFFNLATGAVFSETAGVTGTITDLGDGYFRVTATRAVPGSSAVVRIGLSTNGSTISYAGDAGKRLFIRNAQFNLGSSALTYIPTTTSAVYSLPIDHNPTTFEPLGVLIEEQRTNLCLYSDDFTNAAWVKTNLTAAKTAIGPDGVTNSASTITASASNGVARQAITSASAARSGSVYLKRRTGTGAVTIAIGETTGSELVVNGTFATDVTGWTDDAGSSSAAVSGAINVTTNTAYEYTYQAIAVTVGKIYRLSFDWIQKQGGGRFLVGASIGSGGLVGTAFTGSGQVFYFVATAATIYISLGAPAGGVFVNIYDNISLFEVAETTIDLSSGDWVRGSIVNKTITNPCFAIKLATSGDAVDVDIAGIEDGAFITSPIPTVASQVTRLADQVSILTSAFAYSATVGTVVANIRFANYTAGYGRLGGIVGIGSSSPRAMLYMATGAGRPIRSQTYDGVNIGGDLGPNFADLAVNTEHKTAFAYEGVAGGSDALTWNGIAASSTVHANTVTLPSVGATLFVGNRPDTPNYFNGHIKRLTYFPTRRTDADLQVLTRGGDLVWGAGNYLVWGSGNNLTW